ncbi:MAG: phage holin family protein [Campylobacterales bacterium]|nr:phage holin family protein [Campylobacterales bacterium]
MLTEGTIAKAIYNTAVLCLGGTLTYLGLNAEGFLLFALLILIDYITGVAKAKVLGHSITSNKMKYGIISKLSLLFIPLVLAIGAKAVSADFATILFVGINILVISEVYSIIGNIYSIRTKEELPEYDVIAILGRRIRKILIKYGEEGV